MKITALIISLYILLSFNNSKAQSYSISYSEISIMSLSVSITYYGSAYSSPYFNTASALNTLQQRYNYYYGMINNEWGRLEEFDLLNESNRIILNNHKIDVRNYFAQNNGFTYVDWAQNGQFAVQVVNYIGAIYNYSSIKNEISLLKAINSEYRRLKQNNPDNFHKSTRYSELALVLNKLKSCSTSEIGNLAVTYGLW
jgi:hypothetical protein